MSQNSSIEAKVAQLTEERLADSNKRKFRVFVFGPYLEPDTIVPRPETTADDSSHTLYSRFNTKKKIEENGFPVHFGESSEINDIWQKNIGMTDPATAEIAHARHFCGAIVIYASSVGSFCELGLFASYEAIMQKTLVIVDKQYESANSFLNKGLLEIVRQENGRVDFIDFKDHEKCAEAAKRFVEGKYTKFLRDYVKIEEAEHTKRNMPLQ